MALVFCTKCGHRVSTIAPRCPSCGAVGPAAKSAGVETSASAAASSATVRATLPRTLVRYAQLRKPHIAVLLAIVFLASSWAYLKGRRDTPSATAKDLTREWVSSVLTECLSREFKEDVILKNDSGERGVAAGFWRENQLPWSKTAYDLTESGKTLFASSVTQGWPMTPYKVGLRTAPEYKISVTGIGSEGPSAEEARQIGVPPAGLAALNDHNRIEFTWSLVGIAPSIVDYVQTEGHGFATAARYGDGWRVLDAHLSLGMSSRHVDSCYQSKAADR